ncbi:MAG TPA: hypothetical protein VM029_09320 [Opitutaceae bacterium]|nr:hypothetical protein [Opitutaceae bacterium]
MNPKELIALHAGHVIAVLVMLAYSFFALAAAPESRKRVLMITGIASLVVLLTGARMWQGMFGFAAMAWIIVKLVCWLLLSGLTGMAYRKRDKAGALAGVMLLLAAIAVVMVYAKP